MKPGALEHLGLSPAQCTPITGPRRTRLINFLLRWEQHETALACAERMLVTAPDRVSLLDAKTEALLGLGAADAALAVAQARNLCRTSLSSELLLARVHLARGDTSAALSIANQLTADRPDSVTAWDLLATAHLAAGNLNGAEQALRRLGEISPLGRRYLSGMLALFQAQEDYVTASAYAARLQRTTAEGESLPARTMRRLRDYFLASGDINRAEDMAAELRALYQHELAELDAAIAEDVKKPRDTGSYSAPGADPVAPITVEESAEPLPEPEAVGVSHQERQRLQSAVQEYFGFNDFLPGQAETMAAMLRSEDVLTILPTGGGKSLCYQVPALLDEAGTTLVISPLIALMKDQVDSLPPAARQRATTINSSLDGAELNRRLRAVASGRFRLVYAAPERLRQPPFLHTLRCCGVNRLVIDEAHCVSVWGHDFRPDYLTISQARQALGNPPLLAMTATAPPRVRRDILQRLGRREREPSGKVKPEMAIVAAEVHRPNLFLARTRARSADDRLQRLLSFCEGAAGSGIVYAGTRARCEQVAVTLRRHGISAAHYHAGIQDRAAVQDAFMSGDIRVVVATIAFGMGIDKADIRFIVHLQLPSSLEAYYQEVGRAGRDGLPAYCLLIYTASDRATLTRRAKRDALTLQQLHAVYEAVKDCLADESLGRVASDDLLRCLQTPDVSLRVALSNLEQVGLLRRHDDIARTAVVRLLGTQGVSSEDVQDADWLAFITAARLRPGQPLAVDLIPVARKAGLDPTTIEEQLLSWAEAGRLEYRPASRDLLLQILPPPPDSDARAAELIERYAAIQAQRIDEIAAYASTRRCRHGHISAYLSGRPMSSCNSCDNCMPDAAPTRSAEASDLPSDADQLKTVLQCVADTPWSWGRLSLIYILLGSSRAPERGPTSPGWGALAFRSHAAVQELLDRLVAADLLCRRRLGHGGFVLELTPTGRAALKDPDRLPSVASRRPSSPGAHPDSVPSSDQSGETDESLFERLRAWRLETAKEAGLPAFVVAHDTLLQRIASARPKSVTGLAQLKGIGPKKLAQYGAAILAVVNSVEEP